MSIVIKWKNDSDLFLKWNQVFASHLIPFFFCTRVQIFVFGWWVRETFLIFLCTRNCTEPQTYHSQYTVCSFWNGKSWEKLKSWDVDPVCTVKIKLLKHLYNASQTFFCSFHKIILLVFLQFFCCFRYLTKMFKMEAVDCWIAYEKNTFPPARHIQRRWSTQSAH